MQVFGYCRVSTTEQADDGVSLAAQAADRRRHDEGLETSRGVHRGGRIRLGAAFERPEGRRLLQAVSKGAIVITAKLDRMFRSAARCAGDARRAEGPRRGVLHMIDLGGDVTWQRHQQAGLHHPRRGRRG